MSQIHTLAEITTSAISFKGHDGSMLAARLDQPKEGSPRAYALFAHCFTCSKDVFAANRISQALASHGFGVLRFDFTGLGASEGDFANSNFSSNIDDLVLACEHLAQNYGAPQLLIGHSLGGAAVLPAATRMDSVKAVVTIGAPADPAHVTENFGYAVDQIDQDGEAEVKLGGFTFTIKKQFIDDLRAHNLGESLPNLKKALMVMHAPRDHIVDISNAAQIFGAAKHPKSFVSLDEADHLLSRRADAVFAAEIIASWSTRYIDFPAQSEHTPDNTTAPLASGVSVSETGKGKFQQQIQVGQHSFLADEPKSVGGEDTGPGPYDFLLAALGACTSMTMRMYADFKKLPLERASLTLSHQKIHAKDCEECETHDGKIDEITRVITLEGPLDDAQRKKLLEIADKCPVHRSLESENRVITMLADEA